VRREDGLDRCPGQKPAFLVFNRPARPYKIPVQNGFSQENAKGALNNRPGGPGPSFVTMTWVGSAGIAAIFITGM
jgi:hypothetical protein